MENFEYIGNPCNHFLFRKVTLHLETVSDERIQALIDKDEDWARYFRKKPKVLQMQKPKGKKAKAPAKEN